MKPAESYPNPHVRWRNRRAMAWASMAAGLMFPALLLVTESDQLGAIAGPFYVFVGAVVGAYIGFATVDDKWSKEQTHGYNTSQDSRICPNCGHVDDVGHRNIPRGEA